MDDTNSNNCHDKAKTGTDEDQVIVIENELSADGKVPASKQSLDLLTTSSHDDQGADQIHEMTGVTVTTATDHAHKENPGNSNKQPITAIQAMSPSPRQPPSQQQQPTVSSIDKSTKETVGPNIPTTDPVKTPTATTSVEQKGKRDKEQTLEKEATTAASASKKPKLSSSATDGEEDGEQVDDRNKKETIVPASQEGDEGSDVIYVTTKQNVSCAAPLGTATAATDLRVAHRPKNDATSGDMGDYDTVQQTVQDLLALLQQYGALTKGQLEYNLPPSPYFSDILELLVAIGLVQKVEGDEDDRYCVAGGVPRETPVYPSTIRDDIQQAFLSAQHSWERSQILIEALRNKDTTTHPKDVLKQILQRYPEIIHDPVYLTAIRSCHVDVSSRASKKGTAKRKAKEEPTSTDGTGKSESDPIIVGDDSPTK